MTSQNFPLKKKNGFDLKKGFYAQTRSFPPKIDPHVNFSNFQAEEIFSLSKFLKGLDEKRAAATPD